MMNTPQRADRSSMRRRAQAGLTLVELMVALTLGLLVAAAAVAALIVARQGFTSVDGSIQLRENVRFASSLIQRITIQAGYYDAFDGAPPDTAPGVRGSDDVRVTVDATGPTYAPASGVNGSDALAISYWGASLNPQGGLPADGSMIDCAGIAEPRGLTPNPSADPANRATSVFHVAIGSSGEPTLACSYRDPATGIWASVPLIEGVESMQVLYGVDDVTPGTPPPVNPAVPPDSVPDRYLRASQIDLPGAADPLANWRRVRSIRIGLVVRGPANAAVDRAATAQTLHVLGDGFSRGADVGSDLVIATADGRLRQQLVFTVHLRNTQDPQ